MIDPDDDPSMLVRRISGQDICRAQTARVLAEMLIKDIHGAQTLSAQVPLQVEEQEDRWIIRGGAAQSTRPHPTGLKEGPIEIEILKANCRVVKFAGSLS